MSNVSIETTQNVSLDYVMANAGERLLEGLIDFFIVIVYVIGAIKISDISIHDEISDILIFAIVLFPAIFYSLYMEIFFNGQTVGKKIMKTRVIMLDGSRPSIGSYLIRWLFKLVDVWIIGFPGVIGLTLIVGGNKGQRLGDILAGTTVIKLSVDISLEDTLFSDEEAGYEIRFPQVFQLSDQQLHLIKEALQYYEEEQNYLIVKTLSDKLKTILQIETDLGHIEFLKILLKDYTHHPDMPQFGRYQF